MNDLKLPWKARPVKARHFTEIVNSDDELVATVECAQEADVIVEAVDSDHQHAGIYRRQNEYLALQIAVIEKELEKAAGPVHRNESAENARHGPQALESRAQRLAAEAKAGMSRALLDRLPKVTSALMHRAHNHDAIVQDMERRHAEECRKLRRAFEHESMARLSTERNASAQRGELMALQRITKGFTRHGIDKIEEGRHMTREPDAYTISEFCARHNISRSGFYVLPDELRPRIMRVGARRLISKEAAAEWRHRMEADSSKEAS
jgi:hypothetical protein